MTILAIDQGTTTTRAVLVGPDGGTRIVASLPHRQIHPAPGHVEHDPEELIRNLRSCLDAARAAGAPLAVGIDNPGESCLAWDAATGEAISPVLVWQDDRTRDVVDRLRADGAPRSGLAIGIRQELLSRRGRSPGLEALARSHHMSSRTLIRRLKQQGTSYREIAAEVHAGLAADLLRHTGRSVAEIADRLGFADPANFGRAFRGWFGTSPGRYRASRE